MKEKTLINIIGKCIFTFISIINVFNQKKGYGNKTPIALKTLSIIMNLENILTFSTINISHFMEYQRFYEFFFIFFAFQSSFHNPHNYLSFNHLTILPYSPHKISSIFFTKNSIFFVSL